MIIDSHTHAWAKWPYQPRVPDEDSRGRIEQLLYEMNQVGVDIAVIICACIDHNPDNNDYIFDCIRKYSGRFVQFADIDSFWSRTYHTNGASERLAESAIKYSLKGYTHYLREDDDCAWFWTDEGQKFFKTASDLDLIASIALSPHHQIPLRRIAEKYPETPFLCHHISGAKAGENPPYHKLKEILASARLPNIYIKVSGFAYVSQVAWDYPYYDTGWILRAIYEHFGPDRLCWGSDYPVVRSSMTYRQALEVLRKHCDFIPDSDKEKILGGSLQRLLMQ